MSDKKTCGNCGNFVKKSYLEMPLGKCDVVLPPWAIDLLATTTDSDTVHAGSSGEDCPCWKPQERKDK